MNDHRNHYLLLYDLGYFVELAPLLAPHFKGVFYYSPGAESPCPKTNALLIGTGLDGVERVNHIWDTLRSVPKDKLLIVFPDCGSGPLQVFLRELGYRVWGSARAEELELNRPEAKAYLRKQGFAIGPYKVIVGMDALREYLKTHPGVYVKPNGARGDFESFKVDSYAVVEAHLDRLSYKLGRKRNTTKFIVESPIDPAVEVAYDGYSIDGAYPKSALWGIECKSKGYVGHFVPYPVLPEPVRETNARIAPSLKEYKCRSWFGMEMRVSKKDQVPYIIDPLARFGAPPNEVVQVMYTNLADILWYGAEGKVIDPVCTEDGRWGAELILHWTGEEDDWQVVTCPKAVRPYVKLKNMAVVDGEYCVIPQEDRVGAIGAVVACGKTREEAIATVKKRAEQVKGMSLEYDLSSFDSLDKSIAEFKTYGFTF